MRTIKEDHSPGHAIRLLSQRAPITRVAKTANTSGSFVFFILFVVFIGKQPLVMACYTHTVQIRGEA